MKRSSRARLCATAAVGALSLVLITGCSESGSKDDSKSSESSGTGESAAAKAYTAAELKKLIVARGDVDGYKFGAVDESEFPSDKSAITGEDKCKPLVYVMSGVAPGDAAAETNTMATAEKSPTDTASKSLEDLTSGEAEDALAESMNVDVTIVTLSSYDGGGAEETMKSVSDAIAACAGGFTAGSGGEEQKFTKVGEEQASGTGDESVAFSVTGEMEDTGGQTATLQGEVVRHGSTIASYYTLNIGAMLTGAEYDIPAALIDAQAGKLK